MNLFKPILSLLLAHTEILFYAEANDPVALEFAVLFSVDTDTGKCTAVERVDISEL